METEKEELDDFDETTYFKCPITLKVVNPDIRLPNKRIKQATADFISQNPWAFEFYPNEKFSEVEL